MLIGNGNGPCKFLKKLCYLGGCWHIMAFLWSHGCGGIAMIFNYVYWPTYITWNIKVQRFNLQLFVQINVNPKPQVSHCYENEYVDFLLLSDGRHVLEVSYTTTIRCLEEDKVWSTISSLVVFTNNNSFEKFGKRQRSSPLLERE